MTSDTFRLGCLVVAVAFCLTGCLPIPIPPLGYPSESRTNLPDRVPEFIVKGKTTREEVLLALGAPDSYAVDGRWMTYSSSRHGGGVAFVVGGGYTAGVVGAVNSYEKRLLVVRFDAHSIVSDVALEERTCRGLNDAACSTMPAFFEEANPEVSALATVYVVQGESDAQGIDQLIATELRRRGIKASIGPLRDAPAQSEAILSYRAEWKSDARAGLTSFTTSVRLPGSDHALATATAEQSPSAPKSAADMVADAVAQLFSVQGATFLNFAPYEPADRPVVAAPLERATVRIAPVQDVRSVARGKHIGERSALGAPMGNIDMSPSPAVMVRQVLVAELGMLGYRERDGAAEVEIDARLTRFAVETPSTVLYWDVNGVIAIDLDVQRIPEPQQSFHYETSCSDRTYIWPTPSVVKAVVSACLAKLGSSVREDRALTGLLSGH